MEKNDQRQEGEDRVTEGFVCWQFDGVFHYHCLFADEDDHESESVDGDQDWNQSAVHETNE